MYVSLFLSPSVRLENCLFHRLSLLDVSLPICVFICSWDAHLPQLCCYFLELLPNCSEIHQHYKPNKQLSVVQVLRQHDFHNFGPPPARSEFLNKSQIFHLGKVS